MLQLTRDGGTAACQDLLSYHDEVQTTPDIMMRSWSYHDQVPTQTYPSNMIGVSGNPMMHEVYFSLVQCQDVMRTLITVLLSFCIVILTTSCNMMEFRPLVSRWGRSGWFHHMLMVIGPPG